MMWLKIGAGLFGVFVVFALGMGLLLSYADAGFPLPDMATAFVIGGVAVVGLVIGVLGNVWLARHRDDDS
jgi:hypothetical protein